MGRLGRQRVAATGVPGLATIVPISAISSWYDYMRYQGRALAADYPGYLHEVVNGRPAEACAQVLARLRADSADETGDYNDFWARRDYRPSADRVRASVLVAHGLNDLNVTTNQFAGWWRSWPSRACPASCGSTRPATRTRSTFGAPSGWPPCTAGSTTGCRGCPTE
ncbi:CocE/NonD family hydrolase [Micromonospora sp. M12]